MKKRAVLMVMMAMIICVLAPTGQATIATQDEMEHVCLNWLSYFISQNGQWAGSTQPRVIDTNSIEINGQYLGECFTISPNGYIAVPVLKELPPVTACSEENGLDLDLDGGSTLLLKELLYNRITQYIDTYGDLDVSQPATGNILFADIHQKQWKMFADPEFQLRLNDNYFNPITQVGPLLSTRWHQNAPYNNFCPLGDGGRCVVGCVATAASQILAHYRISGSGTGSSSYFWDGDQSCSGSYAGGTLSGTYSDGYDWGNMPDNCTTSSSSAAQNAVAELCYEVGVALEMDYGYCGSSASTYATATVLPTYFGCKNSASVKYRANYSAQSWLDM